MRFLFLSFLLESDIDIRQFKNGTSETGVEIQLQFMNGQYSDEKGKAYLLRSNFMSQKLAEIFFKGRSQEKFQHIKTN